MAKVNPLRFSTKYQDDETDLFYYGHRYYNTSLGRWISADPIREQGFNVAPWSSSIAGTKTAWKEPSQYVFVVNSPVNHLDFLGLNCSSPCKWARDHQEGETAVTVCCGGKKYACLIFSGGDTGATDPIARTIIDTCILVHEGVHVKDPNYVCPKQCLWKHPTYGSWASPSATNLRAGECAAYREDKACLEQGRSQCKGNPNCEAQVDAEIHQSQKGIDTFCN